ncbi:MAG: MaoC/PaaZ C-terminal domain-containing protein [Ilumatobacteraceae bacterium]
MTTAPRVGDRIPPLRIASVDAQRMKTMAAILRDPYPIHWDRQATAALGLGGRTVNQGPLNLGYIANMLMSWAGDDAIRRLTVGFHGRVLDGDAVEAHGVVEAVTATDSGWTATCSVWLECGPDQVVSGTAEVASFRDSAAEGDHS